MKYFLTLSYFNKEYKIDFINKASLNYIQNR